MESRTLARIAPLFAASIALAAFAADQKLTSAELEEGRVYLQQTRKSVVGATKGLSDAKWKLKRALARWSIGEIVKHMVLAQELVLGPVREKLANARAAPADRDYKQVDAVVVNQLPD